MDGAKEDLFGSSVAIDDIFAVIGAVHDDDNGENSCSAYIALLLPLFRDINGDGEIGLKERNILLNVNWWPFENTDRCFADLDCDDLIGISDLRILLSNWGQSQ